LDPATLAAKIQEPVERAALRSLSQQTAPELGEHREVKPGISQLQAEDIFPINVGAHGVRCLPISQSLRILHESHQSQPPRSLGWLATDGKQISKIFIFKQGA